ncbi:glycoside hydrolase family 68 protein, partial [Sphingobium sp.]|uniref:glycoside hydrolase family 68 protein n=1 Tax=Sphingobium sp. TaxID=1912891 RepID=UPI002B7B3F1A
MIAYWTAADVGAIPALPTVIAEIGADHVCRVSSSLDIWDAWPVQMRDGNLWTLASGAQLWMALGAPRFDNPDERHGHARIHLFRHD